MLEIILIYILIGFIFSLVYSQTKTCYGLCPEEGIWIALIWPLTLLAMLYELVDDGIRKLRK